MEDPKLLAPEVLPPPVIQAVQPPPPVTQVVPPPSTVAQSVPPPPTVAHSVPAPPPVTEAFVGKVSLRDYRARKAQEQSAMRAIGEASNSSVPKVPSTAPSSNNPKLRKPAPAPIVPPLIPPLLPTTSQSSLPLLPLSPRKLELVASVLKKEESSQAKITGKDEVSRDRKSGRSVSHESVDAKAEVPQRETDGGAEAVGHGELTRLVSHDLVHSSQQLSVEKVEEETGQY